MRAAQMRRPVEIMLVEDNVGDARLVEEAMRDSSHRIQLRRACDGVEALALLRADLADRKRPPDLILLDLNLPRLDGCGLLEQIRRDPTLGAIPVIVLTSSEDHNDIRRAYELHANAYLAKSMEFEGLVTMMNDLSRFWFEEAHLPTCQ